jgi:hypothetical protein
MDGAPDGFLGGGQYGNCAWKLCVRESLNWVECPEWQKGPVTRASKTRTRRQRNDSIRLRHDTRYLT